MEVRVWRSGDENLTKPVNTFGETIFVNPDTKRPDIAPYNPEKSSAINQVSAAVHRFGCEMPQPGPQIHDFVAFAKSLIRTHFPHIQEQDVPSHEEWLDATKYKPSRKADLSSQRCPTTLPAEVYKNKSFIKDEGYLKPKMPRGINSYSDQSKTVLGPLIKAVERAVFRAFPHVFVKGTDPRTWPARQLEMFGVGGVMETDFSSFEAHHSGPLADVVHYMFMHVLRGSGIPAYQKRMISQMILGTNVCEFRNITVRISQRLMSGALWTSLANGVLNFLLMSYLNARAVNTTGSPEELAANYTDYFTGLIEGDDGICADRDIPNDLILSLGLKLKFERHEKFSDASFCGCVCDPSTLSVVQNPLKILRCFFALPARYHHARSELKWTLLRAKALSYTITAPNCPVIRPLVDAVLDRTRSYDVRSVKSENDAWKADLVDLALRDKTWRQPGNITMSLRQLVADKFGIPILEQFRMEEAIARWPGHGDIELDLSMYASDEDFRHICDHFVDDAAPVAPIHLPYLPDSVSDALTGQLGELPGAVKRMLPGRNGEDVVDHHHDV